ncbi:MAG: hypothetical protein ACRELY_13550 [Polyangiaceae bacterium]
MAPRTKLGAALAVGIAAAAMAAACGLDDTVITGPGGNGASGGDATLGDGTILLPDGAIITDYDAGDALIHEAPDSADPDDADLSDATPAIDGECAAGSFLCVSGGNVCLGDCSICPGNHAACPTTSACGSSCASCAGSSTECYRSGFLGAQIESCVTDPASCAAVSGSPLFCGQIPLTFIFIDCPGSDQVCLSSQCLTCGEPSTKNQDCSPKSSGKCKDPGPTCQ